MLLYVSKALLLAIFKVISPSYLIALDVLEKSNSTVYSALSSNSCLLPTVIGILTAVPSYL